jgi:ABC-2 type transport system permease protein
VIAFIVAAAICFLLVMSGLEMVQNLFRPWAPAFLLSAISSLSFLGHFENITKGLLALPSIVFYVSLIVFALFANKIIVDQRKAA